jgi:hypothetical protein
LSAFVKRETTEGLGDVAGLRKNYVQKFLHTFATLLTEKAYARGDKWCILSAACAEESSE